MAKVLVISGHPNLESSNTNTRILETLDSNLNDIEIRYLDQLYPDYQINVEAEQEALIKAQVIVLQFPFYWYSIPALLKKWFDDVFSYDFAYGAKGDKLKGKDFILSFTIGGPAESYDPLGYNHFTIEQLILPLQQTAYLAGLNFRQPIYTHQMVYIAGVYNTLEDVHQRSDSHSDRLLKSINELINSEEEAIKRFVKEWFERFDRLPDETDAFVNNLSEDLTLTMPEGTFHGHQGFLDWYRIAKQTFKPDCQHIVEQVTISQENDQWKAELRIRLIAESYPDSSLKGEAVNMLVNEYWTIRFDDHQTLKIEDYLVEPV